MNLKLQINEESIKEFDEQKITLVEEDMSKRVGRRRTNIIQTRSISENEYWSHQGMSLDVLSAGEELAADVAAEGAHTRVDDQMPL